MKKYLTEFIGTFFLVFTICLAAGGGSSIPPLAIGGSLLAMVYMGGPVSGAHYNPAVSISLLMSRKLAAGDLVPYLVAQLAGATAAAATSAWILGIPFAPAPSAGASPLQALAVEFLYSFALCLVVLNVATSKRSAGNSYFGLAIGFTIVCAAFAGGPISGGAFNPAVGLGTILVSAIAAKGSLGNAWLYTVGPILGGVVASWVFEMQEAKA
jgi:aquaporin Z